MKKTIIGIFIFVFSLCICHVSGQYLYFSGTAKHFKQGCSASISMRYNTEGKSTNIANDAVIHSYVKYGLDLGTPSFTKTNNTWGFKKNTELSSVNRYFEFEVNNGTNTVNAGDFQLGTISFTPGYSTQNHYVRSFVFNQPSVQENGSFMSFASSPTYFYNTLTGEINVYQELCSEDNTSPTLEIRNYLDDGTYKNKNNLVINLADAVGSSSNAPYVWRGAPKGTAGSYWTGNNFGVTNQYGVDIDDPNFTVTISGGNSNQVLVLHTGDFTITTGSTKTWEYKDRDYTLTTGLQGFDFGMEKAVTITVSSIKDRTGKTTNGQSITFNRPQEPTVSEQNPSGTWIFRNASVLFKVSDTWAGVDPDTIRVTLSDNSGYSQTFTAAQLNISCASVEGTCGVTGSAGGYRVYLSGDTHDKFTYGKQISVSVSAKDLLGNIGGTNWSFTVIPDCVSLGFLAPTEIWYGSQNQAVSPYTGSELTVSGANVSVLRQEEYELSGVTYTGWIFEIDCHQVESALTLYTGVESESTEIISGLLLDELVLSGANPETIKAELSGNQLTLSYWVDGAEITQISPAVGTTGTSRTVSLNWTLNDMDSYDWISGFVVAIYTGGNPDNLVDSGFVSYVEGKNITGYLDTVDDGSDYYWSVYVVDKAGRTGGIVSTGAFAVEVKYLVGAMTITQIYPTGDVNTGIIDFLWSTGGQIDNTMVGEFSGFIVSVYSGSDVLWTGWTDTTGWTNTTGLENGTYVWKVSAVDNEGRVGTEVSQSFNVQLEKEYTVKVYPGKRQGSISKFGYENFSNTGEIRFYDENLSLVNTGIVISDTGGIGYYKGLLDYGTYYVAYRGEYHLESMLTGVLIQSNTSQFDFTTGLNLIGVQDHSSEDVNGNKYQIAGDFNGDHLVGGGDIAIYVGYKQNYEGNGTVEGDLNLDGLIDVSDLSIIGAHNGQKGPFLPGGDYEEFGGKW